jgi:hypothetical protein
MKIDEQMKKKKERFVWFIDLRTQWSELATLLSNCGPPSNPPPQPNLLNDVTRCNFGTIILKVQDEDRARSHLRSLIEGPVV